MKNAAYQGRAEEGYYMVVCRNIIVTYTDNIMPGTVLIAHTDGGGTWYTIDGSVIPHELNVLMKTEAM